MKALSSRLESGRDRFCRDFLSAPRAKPSGEVVFNTSMAGYQEILTDPSYEGQIITMTSPHIGNYGVNEEDAESRKPFGAGFIVREISGLYSNWRAQESLQAYMQRYGLVGIDRRRHAGAHQASARYRLPARRRFDARSGPEESDRQSAGVPQYDGRGSRQSRHLRKTLSMAPRRRALGPQKYRKRSRACRPENASGWWSWILA